MNCSKYRPLVAFWPEFVDQRTEQARFGLAELAHQVATAASAFDRLASLGEHPLDLFVQLVAVGDDGDAGVGIVLQNPPGEQHHDDALAAALRVPDDAAFPFARVCLRSLDSEILVGARQLLHAVEEDEVVHQLDEPVLPAHLEKVLVQLEAAIVLLVLLPFQEVLLLRTDRAVLQALRVVAGEDELHGAEKPRMEHRRLVRQALPDAIADGDAAVLQLQHADGDAVDVEHEVRASLVVAGERHFLGDGEVVLLWFCPVDEVDDFGWLAQIVLAETPYRSVSCTALLFW